jgi:hypothetical protein
MMWIGLMWLRIGTSDQWRALSEERVVQTKFIPEDYPAWYGGFCENSNEFSGSVKAGEFRGL